jgi:DNA polymerase-1
VSRNFGQVVVCDSEYEVADGDLPKPLCVVAYVLDEHLQHVRTIRQWRGEFSPEPPFDIGPNTLFVAYSAWAEMTVFKVLNWKFPVHIFDQHTAYLAASNILLPYEPDENRTKMSKGLEAACHAYGIEGWKGMNKKEIAKDIGEGRWRKYGRAGVEAYCEEDVRVETELLRAQLRDRCDYHGFTLLPAADTDRVLHWSDYSAKAIALIQSRGMPIDMPLWDLVQENLAAIVRELARQFDPSSGSDDPIYDQNGEWTLERIEKWLASIGVSWPRLKSGRLDIGSKAFRSMYGVPGVEELHQLRDSLGFISKARLPIGPDGRNRPSLFPFGAATGRNAHAKSPYNTSAAMRSFMLFPPETIGANIDWRTQEVGIAAVWSDDRQLKEDYLSGDIYHALARMCGLTDEPNYKKWKKDDPSTRDRMKKLQLGINYGMGVPSLARGLGKHPLIASEILERHRHRYPRFWEWRANMVRVAMLERRIESRFGWPLRITTSPNERTLYNFPMQSGGAEMLRLAAVRLCEAGIVPIMLIHDAILLEESSMEKIEHAKEIMLQAGRDVCDGFEIGVDTDQLLIGGNNRYRDKRPVNQKLWDMMMKTLESIGATPKRDAA